MDETVALPAAVNAFPSCLGTALATRVGIVDLDPSGVSQVVGDDRNR